MGSIVRCSFPVTKGAARHACIIAIKDNKMGVYFYINRSCLHHVIVLIATPFLHELNTLDACWIAVDVWSNSNRCRQESVY